MYEAPVVKTQSSHSTMLYFTSVQTAVGCCSNRLVATQKHDAITRPLIQRTPTVALMSQFSPQKLGNE